MPAFPHEWKTTSPCCRLPCCGLTAKYLRLAALSPVTFTLMLSMRHWETASPAVELHAAAVTGKQSRLALVR